MVLWLNRRTTDSEEAGMAPFRIRVVRQSSTGTVRVGLAGEFDLQARAELTATLAGVLSAAPVPAQVDIDLTATELLDCTAIGVLMSARATAESAGCWLRVVNARGMPRRVLELLELLAVLTQPSALHR